MDIEITGKGFYQIRACTRSGVQFMQHVQGFAHGAAYCDDSRMARDIAEGATAEGLAVVVNGTAYTTAAD